MENRHFQEVNCSYVAATFQGPRHGHCLGAKAGEQHSTPTNYITYMHI